MRRREFVTNSSMLGIASLVQLKCKVFEMTGRNDVGLQLYTVRNEMEKDPVGTLKIISEMGYTHVESTGYDQGKHYGMSPKSFFNILSDLGLKMYSSHTRTGSDQPEKTHTMTNQWERVCEDAASLDQQYLVLGYLVENERKTIDDYKRVAELCNSCGEIAREFGLSLAYHNHAFEFEIIEGTVPYHILLSETDPDFMDFEIDLFWTRKGEVEALEYFENFAGRFPLWHIKDMDDSPEKNFTEIGNGTIDWSKYFNVRDKASLKHFYVEQDQCFNNTPLESIRISYEYLSKTVLKNG